MVRLFERAAELDKQPTFVAWAGIAKSELPGGKAGTGTGLTDDSIPAVALLRGIVLINEADQGGRPRDPEREMAGSRRPVPDWDRPLRQAARIPRRVGLAVSTGREQLHSAGQPALHPAGRNVAVPDRRQGVCRQFVDPGRRPARGLRHARLRLGGYGLATEGRRPV